MSASSAVASGPGPVPTGPFPPAGGPGRWARHLLHRLRHPTWLDLPFWLLVLIALVTVESAYRLSYVPPGGDSGHWVTTSYSFIGRAHPSDFTDQALLYPPLLFPLIGTFVLLTNSPFSAALLTGGALLFLYGVTSIHLARRFLKTPAGQLLFVGLALLNGTTLQMLFWAGYPNFLGFAVLNEAMIFLLAALLTRGFWEWVGVGVFAAALYLTHDLSFVIFAAGALIAGIFALVRVRGDLSIYLHRGVVVAAGIFAAAYLLFDLAARLAGVTHAGYLFSNPTTYVVDPIALVFRPFYFAPAFFPSTAATVLTSGQTVELLLGVAGVLGVGTLFLLLLRPRRMPVYVLVVTGWIIGVLAVPALGYLAHVDTDYPRFAYFLPLPAALGLVIVAEWGLPRAFTWGSPGPSPSTLSPLPPSAGFRRPDVGPMLGVALVLLLLFVTVTAPSVQRAEADFENPSHSSEFVAAAEWIQHQSGGGEILTDPTTARWIEALTDRTALSTGPTWLHFYAQQILDDELAYWALNAHYVATDNHGALAFSGYNASALDAFPQYVAYLEGIPFPVLRLAESTLAVGYSGPLNSSTQESTFSPSWGTPTFTLSSTSPTVTARFVAQNFTLSETVALAGNGTGTIQLYVLPAAGVMLHSLSFQLAAPTLSFLGGTVQLGGIGYSGGGARNFTWTVRGPEGALPGTTTLVTTGTFSVAPDYLGTFTSPALHPSHLDVEFTTPSTGFAVQLRLAAPGLLNPAVTLPPAFDAHRFVTENDIQYVMVQNNTANSVTEAYYASEYGFQPAFENSQWTVYEA